MYVNMGYDDVCLESYYDSILLLSFSISRDALGIPDFHNTMISSVILKPDTLMAFQFLIVLVSCII